jgi:hypothetical protein
LKDRIGKRRTVILLEPTHHSPKYKTSRINFITL